MRKKSLVVCLLNLICLNSLTFGAGTAPPEAAWKHKTFSRHSLVAVRLKDVDGYENVVSYLDIGVQELTNNKDEHLCRILDPRVDAHWDGDQIAGDLQKWKAVPFDFYTMILNEKDQAANKNVLGSPDVFFPGDDFNRNRMTKADVNSGASWTRAVDPKYDQCFTWKVVSRSEDSFVHDVNFARGGLDWKGVVGVRTSYDPGTGACNAWALLCTDVRVDAKGVHTCGDKGWKHALHEIWAYPDQAGYAADLARSLYRTLAETDRNDLKRLVAQVSKIETSPNGSFRASEERTVEPLAKK